MDENFYLFFSRDEIDIYNTMYLSVNLPKNDFRVEILEQIYSNKNLKFIVYNPRVRWVTKFLPDKWYLLPNLQYTGKHRTYTTQNYSFRWSNVNYKLLQDEIDFFRKNLYLKEQTWQDY